MQRRLRALLRSARPKRCLRPEPVVIDIASIIGGSAVVLGLALVLATWSRTYATAQARSCRIGQVLAARGYREPLSLGLALAAAGMAAADPRVWARAAWGALAVLVATGTGVGWMRSRRENRNDDGSEHDADRS